MPFCDRRSILPLSYAPIGLALTSWRHFDLGWVELHPAGASIEAGANVAVLVRYLGFWSLNGCRVLAVSIDPASGAVSYTIRAVARPRALLARAGYPIVRRLQARFRVDSARAMQRAID